ncbi:TonB-dependent receptor [bacterium]|nr:TonB-dependent receptor [bacterium]MBU1916527.1 TonB-dependent receptor [bacterium]
MKNILFTTCLLCFLCSAVFAQAGPIVEIDKIIITDRVPPTTSEPITSQPDTSIILRTTMPRTESAAHVVEKTAGVHVQHYGGLEEATSVSIRGSSSMQVNVFLDGVPLEAASADGVGLGHVAATTLSKVEVFKSLTPSEFGSSAIGGVVNLKTKKAEQGINQRYGLSYGSFNTLSSLAELTYGGEKNDIVFGFNYRRTDGDYTYLDNNGTPLNATDDQRVKRQNNEQQVMHPYGKWHHAFNSNTSLSVTQHLFRIDSGVPGLANFQSTTADRSLTESLTNIDFKKNNLWSGKFSLKNKTFFRLIKSQFSDPNAEIGLGQAQDNDNLTLIAGNRFLGQTAISDNILFKKGFEYIFEYFLPKDYIAANPRGETSLRHQVNLFFEPHIYLFHKRALLSFKAQSLNALYDVNNNDPSFNNPGTFSSNRIENQITGTVAADYEIVKSLHAKASFGRAVRLPKFVEMFGDQGFVLGNPQLTSEKSLKFDAGMIFHKKYEGAIIQKVHFETSYFENHTDNLILFELASGFARASNIGEALIRGFEVAASTTFLHYISLMGNYTYQWAKDEAVNVGNFLVGRPRHEINSSIRFEKSSFATGIEFNFIDDQYLDGLNTQRIDNRVLLHYDVSYLIKEKVRLGLEVKNLTNSQVVDAVGFPLPGRSFFGRVDVYF